MDAGDRHGDGAAVLICGASFAGLCTAFWLHRLGYRVTLVELAKGLRRGGTPVDIKDRTVGIVERMGVLSAIRARGLPPRMTEFKDADDRTTACLPPQSAQDDGAAGEVEIERDVLLDILFAIVEPNVEVRFGASVTALTDTGTEVRATFADGSERAFSLVFGCDGSHSAVRRMCFGPEASYSRFLGQYFSISIVDAQLIAPNTTQIFSVPGRTILLNSYEGKTDIVFSFHAETEIAYDYRDHKQQRRIVREHFAAMGWRTSALLEAWEGADNFYFDKLCQIKMPAWTRGRVALVGDAAYAASPAAGMGGSLAIVGAAALADAFVAHPGDLGAAFAGYDDGLRPYIEDVQAQAVDFGLPMFFPRTEDELRARDAQLAAMAGEGHSDAVNLQPSARAAPEVVRP